MKESKSRKISFRLSDKLYTTLKIEAEEEELTLSKWIIKVLENRPQKLKENKTENRNWLAMIVCVSLFLVFYTFIKTRRILG
ncbi:hypothetical protein [uncultured Arcticibacterium sp.]|mgnify:CR=1 FL=1|uniref:hypothetical protein n=1 Tax=uncultured Arcticibacterium sp. TaxID=2173042 RepID=UPI0030FA5F0A